MRIRLLTFVITLAAACFAPAGAADTVSTGSIVLHADAVDYYGNRFIVTADGHVRARLPDGTLVTGETFAMDLKLNRFVIAGRVHIVNKQIDATGAALSSYPDLGRTYFLPEGDIPDRWTFFGDNYTDHHAGRDQPGDAFNLPDLGNGRPFVKSDSVVIYPKNNIEFPFGSRISIEGAYTPTPGWVVNFSSNSNFYQNGYAGAVFDIQVPFRGSANDITALDIRYDQVRGAYLAFEEHVVHNLDYYVFTLNPIDQNERQWNFIGYHRWSPALETRLFTQLSTLSHYPWSEPSQSSLFTSFQINTKVGKYAVQALANQYNNTLLPTDNSAFSAQGLRVDGHPLNVQVSLQSFEDEWRLFRYLGVPLKFQYRGGYGWNYDGYGILQVNGQQTWGGAVYPGISDTFVGATVYTPSIRIAKQTTISVKNDHQRQWFSLPHHIDTNTFTITTAYTPTTTKTPAAFLSYNVLNVGDYYGKDQLMAYPAFGCPGGIPGQPAATGCGIVNNQFGHYTGLDAFRGLATSRNVTGSVVYTPTPYFAVNLTGQYFDVTPAAVPGQGGQPPFQISADVRFRLTPNLLVDVQRGYFFNFGDDRWSPQFTVTLSP